MSYKDNITKLNWFRFFKWGKLVIVVEALFFIAGGLTFAEYLYLFAIWAFLVWLLEIPSGAFADLVGRRNTLILASIFELGQLVVYVFAYSFWAFFIARIFAAITNSLFSGTDSALLYDSSKKAGLAKDFKKINSHYHFMSHLGMAVFFPIGALLFSIHPKLPAVISVPFITTCLFIAISLEKVQNKRGKLTFKAHWKHMKESVIFAYSHKYVRFMLLYLIPISIGVSYTLSASSVYQEKIGIPIALIGVIGAISSFIGAFVIKNSYSIESHYGEKLSIIAIPIILIITLYLHSLMVFLFGVFFMFIIKTLDGYTTVITDSYLHKHIKPSHRATVMSVKNQLNWLVPGIFIVFAGKATETIGFAETYNFTAVVIAIPVIAILVYAWFFIYASKTRVKINS